MPGTTLDCLRAASPCLSVGLLTADLLRLGDEVRLLESTGVAAAHFDVMDGVFCPMMTAGPPFVKAVRTPLIKDVHLMIDEPLGKLDDYVAAGADMIVVHVESSAHPHRLVQALGERTNANDPARGIVRGIALNPGTPVETIQPLLGEVDVVFLLAVNPGFKGQKFIASTARRAERVLRLAESAGRSVLLGIDGGVTKANARDIAEMGADIIVTGSAVFDGKDAAGNARAMLEAVASARRH